MAQRGMGTTLVEGGRIINVDVAHWTVDVQTTHSQRKLLDMQVGAPYLHFARGEGIYAMPEVGSKVEICLPSDGSPFVLCFVTTFEREGAAGDASTHPDEPSAVDAPSEVTYRAGRPRLQQGDIMLRCRDGNQIWLHRGGVVEIGSTGLAKRLYIPVANTVRDVCENYRLLSPAGAMQWTVKRSDVSADEAAEAVFSMDVSEHAQDTKASVLVQAGYVDAVKRLQLLIAPTAIDRETGEVEGDAVYALSVDNEGNVESTIAKNVQVNISGELSLRADQAASFQFSDGFSESVTGDYSTEITGSHTLRARSSKEIFDAQKVIEAQIIKCGSENANTPVILATNAVLQFLAGHIHGTPAGPTTPPTIPVTPPQAIARKLYGE